MLGYDMNIVERGIRGIFGKEFITRQRKVRYEKFCTVINSDKKEEKYNMISTLPQLAEVEDERVLSGFSEYTYSLQNKIYATGIKMPRSLFEFDQTGQLRTLVQSLSSRTVNFPDKLVFAIIGTNGTSYDTQNFFDTDHDLGNGVSQINARTGLLASDDLLPTSKTARDNAIAAFQGDLMTAKTAMLAFTDDRGEPWFDDIAPEDLMVLCHPQAEFIIRTALEANMISDTGNLTNGAVRQVITTNYAAPFLGSDGSTIYPGTWYLLYVGSAIQPFIFQRFAPKANFPDTIPESDHKVLQALNGVEVQSIMRTGQQIDSQTFFNDEFLFGARVIYSAGYGMWQYAYRTRDSDYA